LRRTGSLSEVTDHPLHLGVTEAGPPPAGTIKGTAGIGTLLSEGIGDTIRYSLTADPVEEAKAGRVLLEALGLRERTNVDLIACPACGRAEIDVYKVAQEVQAALEGKEIPLQVAVMGCVVNGPGEARSADLGIAAGKHRGHLFIQGQILGGDRGRGGGASGAQLRNRGRDRPAWTGRAGRPGDQPSEPSRPS